MLSVDYTLHSMIRSRVPAESGELTVKSNSSQTRVFSVANLLQLVQEHAHYANMYSITLHTYHQNEPLKEI